MSKADLHTHRSATGRGRRMPGLTTQILVGLFAGILVGYFLPDVGIAIKPLADIFLRMIKMIIAPLLFATLAVGIAGTGDLKAMGRIGLKGHPVFEGRDDRGAVSGLGTSTVQAAPGSRCQSPGHGGGGRIWLRTSSTPGLLPAHVSRGR
jgi:proton glutamate symport protein